MEPIKKEQITPALLSHISDGKPNQFQIIMQTAFANPEKIICTTADLCKVLKSTDKDISEAFGFFTDHKNKYIHVSGSAIFAGESNAEIILAPESELLQVCLMNSSKMVINCDNPDGKNKTIIVNLFDNSEVYVDVANKVKVFVCYLSENVKATFNTDDSCDVILTLYGHEGSLKLGRENEDKY